MRAADEIFVVEFPRSDLEQELTVRPAYAQHSFPRDLAVVWP
jgi:hypothetical protein